MREYLKYNPIARQLFESQMAKSPDNKKIVQDFIGKIVSGTMDVFKAIVFDMAPGNERNPDMLRIKLADVSNSKNLKEAISKIKDYSGETGVSSRLFSDTKQMYVSALGKLCETLEIIDEVSKDKSLEALSNIKSSCLSLQKTIDVLATQKAKKIAEAKKALNESIFVGFGERIENLKKLLYNLISSAEGKNQKTGYGKDWKRIFIDLDQKLEFLEANRAGITEKDRSLLEDIENKIEKYANEYLDAVIQSSGRMNSDIEQNEELKKYYSDACQLFSEALDLLTRAKSLYMEVLKSLREEIEENEIEVVKYVFPIKMGDDDNNKRFGGTGIISILQDALADGIPSSAEYLKSGGERGTYGPKTESVVKAIQKNIGNKDISGKLDKSLLDSILVSDFISDKHRKSILEALRSMKKPLRESVTSWTNSDLLLENKIVLDKETFTKDLKHFTSDPDKKTNPSLTKNEQELYDADALAKRLRSLYGLKLESDDFKREDGSFKSSYSGPFIKTWYDAVENVGDDKAYQYFFWDGGVYALDSDLTSLKSPSNWKAWSSIRQLRSLSDDDCIDFMESYLKDWNTFGMTRVNFRSSAIKTLYKKNSELELDYPGIYEMIAPIVSKSDVPFIPYDFLTKKVAKAIEEIAEIGDSNPDLDASNMVVLNNILCMVANTVSFNGEKFISSIKWIYDNCLTPAVAKRISADSITVRSEDSESHGNMLCYDSQTIKVRSTKTIINEDIPHLDQYKDMDDSLSGWQTISKLASSSTSSIKSTLGETVYFIGSRVYPSVKIHVKRMNASQFTDVPQEDSSKCFKVKEG
jgi:hypothetical protein